MNQFASLKVNPVWREAKDYLLIALGMMMYGIGWTVFLLPNNLPSGAVPGIASIASINPLPPEVIGSIEAEWCVLFCAKYASAVFLICDALLM